MAQSDLHGGALQFMRDWDAGKQPSLRDYLPRDPGDARELMEFVANYVVFGAMTPTPAASPSVHSFSPS